MPKTAVLITCHNRKEKTLKCLESLYVCDLPVGYTFDVYLVDDGSTDRTSDAVRLHYPLVNIIMGNGNLFWAGGMRVAWQKAMETKKYDIFFLINDDTILNKDVFSKFEEGQKHSIKVTGKTGIYSGGTADLKSGSITYGAIRLVNKWFLLKTKKLLPTRTVQKCDLTNANILFVDSMVVNKIGIIDDRFTHGIADYDYSLRAIKAGFPVWLLSGICGYCSNDHGNTWKGSNAKLKDRIAFLKSPKGLAYSEYLFYIKRHFPTYLPVAFLLLWVKTMFPFFWDRYKINN